MKKIAALTIGVALVGSSLAACWYTGSHVDQTMEEQIAKVNQNDGIELNWLPNKHNLFARDGVLQLTVSPEKMAVLSSELDTRQPLTLRFVVTHQIFPLYVKSHLRLDTQQGSLADMFSTLGMTQWQLGLESVSSLWSQSSSGRFWANEFTLKQAANEFRFLPIHGEYRGDLGGDARLTLAWQGMTLRDTLNGLDVEVADLTGSADLADISGLWLSPQSEMSLAALTVQLPDNTKWTLQGLTSATAVTGDDAQTLSSRYQVNITKLALENESDALTATDNKLALRLNGLDIEGYQQLQAANGSGIEDEAAQQALDTLLRRGVSLELTELSSKLNGEPITLSGEATLASTTLEQLFSPGQGMQALSGTLRANLSRQLGSAVPQLNPLIEAWAHQGYLKTDSQQLSAQLELAKGAITVNDLPL
ncbi:DUF945 family protein [Aeromonas cavernicola]|uniref:DUF945 domain-containing protein n=1 Tax=Aeromonas cavernicola TaxID=1006623 RepID=A0A2H9U2M8_9GAMM|nr:DUF945 family protein [Aeromonas cavernicola]PJG58275.1 hypothetical protein CUC53_13420 [Aeromonas cavernicola]